MRMLMKIGVILLLIAVVLIGLLTFGIRATASNGEKAAVVVVATAEAGNYF